LLLLVAAGNAVVKGDIDSNTELFGTMFVTPAATGNLSTRLLLYHCSLISLCAYQGLVDLMFRIHCLII